MMSGALINHNATLEILRRHNFRIKKRLGQNFIIDIKVAARIVEAMDLKPDELVLEIGTGVGSLTQLIAQQGVKIVTVEKDKGLLPILEETLKDYPNVKVILGDILRVDLGKLVSPGVKCKVVGNLPYYITSPIVLKLLGERQYFKLMVVTVQEEVGMRMCAAAGGKSYGALSVTVQYYTLPEVVIKVKRKAFFPEPEVDSAIIKALVRQKPVVEVVDENFFFNLVRSVFQFRRKTLQNAIINSAVLKLDKWEAESVLKALGIEPGRRPETLTLQEFARLANYLVTLVHPH